ncbi:hypothetical protein QI122_08060 [Staphylococcus saprophyticus]|nr:hypothetical protein [Staphylococcus saprophyticus]
MSEDNYNKKQIDYEINGKTNGEKRNQESGDKNNLSVDELKKRLKENKK